MAALEPTERNNCTDTGHFVAELLLGEEKRRVRSICNSPIHAQKDLDFADIF
jgi:hypothetical protein